MAISITERPSKTLSNGFLSKWSSSELPLQYELESDLYPVNNVDTTYTITNLVYNPAVLGVVVTFSVAHAFFNLDSVTIDGTNTLLDGNVFSIKATTSTTITLDFFTTETSVTGTGIKYYNNYKGLLKVFVGSPDQHPYNLDGSKPIVEAGIIEVNFSNNGTDNIGLSNVNGYVKAGINAMFDTDENTHYGWGSYYVEYAESYDLSDGNEITNFTSEYQVDEQENCEVFTGFLNPSFDNGLDDWTNTNQGSTVDFTAGVGEVTFTGAKSSILNQDLTIYSGIEYDLAINYNIVDDNGGFVELSIWGYDGVDWVRLKNEFLNGTGAGIANIKLNTNKDFEKIGLAFETGGIFGDITVSIQSFQASTSVVQPCLFTQFANFGVKQFQDNLGGNFGDYVLSLVNTLTPKILTHFEEKTFFKDKPFYFSAIIPESTFSLSQESNNVFLKIDLYKGNTFISSDNYKVENSGEGVYTVDPSSVIPSDCTWDNGTSQFIIIPDNTFADATNGTFENPNPATWNITSLDALGTGFTTSTPARTGLYNGNFGISGASVPQGETELYVFDSYINTIVGLDYQFNGFYYNDGNFAAAYDKKLNICFKIEGTNTTTNKILLDSDNITNQWEALSFTFTATSTSHRIILCIEALEALGGGGASLDFDDLTFKGPIDSISEIKPIKNSCDCNQYGGTLRWLNDLGGWESWYFNRYKTEKETVTKKIDIIRDVNSNWDDTFINGETEKDTIKTFSNKTVLLRSQLLTKNELIQLETIKRSARVQMLMDSGKWQTVTIKTGSYTLNEEEKDIQEMTIEVTLPNTIIQAQ